MMRVGPYGWIRPQPSPFSPDGEFGPMIREYLDAAFRDLKERSDIWREHVKRCKEMPVDLDAEWWTHEA